MTGIVDLLYKKQAAWAFEKSDTEILSRLFAIGRQVGIEEEKINACLQNKNKSLNLIDAYLTNSKADQITSTPTLVVNGKQLKYSSYNDLKARLDDLLN